MSLIYLAVFIRLERHNILKRWAISRLVPHSIFLGFFLSSHEVRGGSVLKIFDAEEMIYR